jgi:hypothetical protein
MTGIFPVQMALCHPISEQRRACGNYSGSKWTQFGRFPPEQCNLYGNKYRLPVFPQLFIGDAKASYHFSQAGSGRAFDRGNRAIDIRGLADLAL